MDLAGFLFIRSHGWLVFNIEAFDIQSVCCCFKAKPLVMQLHASVPLSTAVKKIVELAKTRQLITF